MLLPAALLAATLHQAPVAPPVLQAGGARSAMAEFGRAPSSGGYAHALQAEARRRAFWQHNGSREGRLYSRHRVLACAAGDKSNCW